MISINSAQVWVNDQEESLDFYTKVLGFEIRADVTLPELGDFRWLQVGPTGTPDVGITLMAVPGEPVFDEETVNQIKSLTAKGAASAVFLETDDVYKEYEELKARGLEFIDEPFEQPYGIDCSFRDPSGNHYRLSQLKPIEEIGQ